MSLVILGVKQLLKCQLNLMMVNMACRMCWSARKVSEKMVLKARQGKAMSKTMSLEKR